MIFNKILLIKNSDQKSSENINFKKLKSMNQLQIINKKIRKKLNSLKLKIRKTSSHQN